MRFVDKHYYLEKFKSGGVDETSTGSGDGGEAEHNGEENAGSVLVAKRPEDETHHNGTSNTNDRRSPDVLLGDSEIPRL
jgi:hypothetical protein